MKVVIAYCFVMIIAIICFTFLAYKFNHWWIALFSCFFMFSYHSGDESDKDTKDKNMNER